MYKRLIAICGLVGLGAQACGSDKPTREPASYAELRQSELEQERQEFIRESHTELNEIETEIAHLEARLQHESQFVDERQRAEWRQDLFELRQERQRLSAEVARAETASLEDWSEMRGPVGNSVDTLQATVQKASMEIRQAFGGDDTQQREQPSAPTAAEDQRAQRTCPAELADADVEVNQVGQAVAIDATTDDQRAASLRQKVRQIADKYPMNQGRNTQQGRSAADLAETSPSERQKSAAMRDLVDKVAIYNIDGGVRVLFTPKQGKSQQLYQELQSEVAELDNGGCPETLQEDNPQNTGTMPQ